MIYYINVLHEWMYNYYVTCLFVYTVDGTSNAESLGLSAIILRANNFPIYNVKV
jgi:hypothetical protein